jgi:hypothetical protein
MLRFKETQLYLRNTTNKYTQKYVSLLFYKQRSLLHVSATIVAIFREMFFEGCITYSAKII